MSHIENLKRIVGEQNALDNESDIRPYLTDWRGHHMGSTPLIVFPENSDLIQKIVFYCYKNNIRIVTQGGNTSLCGANIPFSDESQLEIVLNTSKLNKILEIDDSNQSMLVESGCILKNIQIEAESNGFLFPLSLSAEGSCQIGGNVSTNAGGINVLKYGMTRDQVMGLEVILPDGSIFSDLKSLRKNNTGYDLKQLFIGAEGTLGIISKVSLKLYTRPRNTVTVLASSGSIENCIKLLKRSKSKFGCDITAFEIMSNTCLKAIHNNLSKINQPLGTDSNWQIIFEIINHHDDEISSFFEYALSEGLVQDGVQAKNEKERESLWLIRHSISEAERISGKCIHHDISLPIREIPHYLESISKSLDNIIKSSVIYTFGHLGDGNLHFTIGKPNDITEEEFLKYSAVIKETVYDAVESFGGSFSAEHGIGVNLLESMEKYTDLAKINLLRKIKRLLDTKNIMNPNKVIKLD